MSPCTSNSYTLIHLYTHKHLTFITEKDNILCHNETKGPRPKLSDLNAIVNPSVPQSSPKSIRVK